MEKELTDKQRVADRLKKFVEVAGLSSGKELGQALGYKRADNIYNVLNADILPGFALLRDLSNKFEYLNINWLLTGEGGMRHGADTNNAEIENPSELGLLKELSESLKRENALLREKVANYAAIEAGLKEQGEQLGLIRQELAELKASTSPVVIPPLKYSSGRKSGSSSPKAART